MEIIRIPRIMHDTCWGHALRSKSIGFVPTMGALHEGHMALIRASRQENDITVVSIFVNPAQFGPGEDLSSYPREQDEDIKKLRSAQVDYAFIPAPEAMYPEGFQTSVHMGGITGRMCGEFRPGHFDGVATVVLKLFNIVRPKRAYFGLKDYQQCAVIKRLTADMNLPIEIVECPIVREPDGLAMSSRNAYLGEDERRAGTVLYRVLNEAVARLRTGGSTGEDVASFMRAMLTAEPLVGEIQYAGAYDPATLDPIAGAVPGRTLFAIALKIGKTRLIDNMVV